MYRFTDHFLVPVGVSMYADSAVFCPIDTHPPIYPNPGYFYSNKKATRRHRHKMYTSGS